MLDSKYLLSVVSEPYRLPASLSDSDPQPYSLAVTQIKMQLPNLIPRVEGYLLLFISSRLFDLGDRRPLN